MPQSGWAIRFYEANNYTQKGTIDFESNYGPHKRTLDTIIAFTGMYGLDDYLVWYMHKSIPSYDFSTVALDVRLTMYKNPEAVYFQDFYRVQDVRYDANKSMYILYAVSEGSLRLKKKLIEYRVQSLSYKEDRKAVDIIKDVIEKNNIFYVKFHEDTQSTSLMPHYEYRYFDIDLEWTVLDFIQYICNDNMYEWCIDKIIGEDNVPHYILHIGHELQPFKYRNATKPYEKEKDNISETIYGFKVTTEPSPMTLLSHWEEGYKCVWAKHTSGKGGGVSRGYFTRIGQGHYPKDLFLKSLEGSLEKDTGYSVVERSKRRYPSAMLGNIIDDYGTDEGEVLPYINAISTQRDPRSYTIREPHNVVINRGDDLAVKYQLERVSRWSPFLDHGAGIQFPSPKLFDDEGAAVIPPNSLIFNVEGKRESAVHGGYVYGSGRQEFEIPYKERDDFRFRIQDGAEIFYSPTDKHWVFQCPEGFAIKTMSIEEPSGYPKGDFKEGEMGEVSLFRFWKHMLMYSGPTQYVQWEPAGCFHQKPQTDENGNVGLGKYEINYWNDLGQIDLYADNKINIKISKAGGEIDIEVGPDGSYAGTININCAGTINIGANATAVNIAGGTATVARGTHTHQTGNMGIPIPPTTDITVKTKVD